MSIRVRAGMKQKIKKQRYTVLDILRGIAVIMMVIYHTMWDVVYLFGVQIPYFKDGAGFVFQQSICWTFILVSGFCWSLGGKKLKRALTVIVCALVLTAVTAVVMPDSIIIHGVLSFLGVAMLVMIPADRVLVKVPPTVGMAVSAVLFMLTYNIDSGIIGFGKSFTFELPESLYANTLTAFFGFPHKEFFSADYFPLFPWIFLFLTGYFLYGLCRKKDLLRYLSVFTCRPLEFIGRHSLEIYMAHQPIIYALLFLIFKLK